MTFSLLGASTPGYDPMRQYVSLLALGAGGWIQSANFIVTGVLVAAAGLALARRWASAKRGATAARLVSIVGVSLAWCGVFSGDPALGYPAGAPAGMPTDMSWHAGLHYLGAVVVFVGLPAAMLAAGQAVGGGRWARSGRLSAAVMLLAWLATFGLTDIAGLLQRVAVVAGLGWLAATSARELGRTRPAGQLAREASRA